MSTSEEYHEPTEVHLRSKALMHLPTVSVVIRNRNESKSLVLVLKALSVQSHAPKEIILVDNDSSDDSVEIARSFGALITRIPKNEFTYGRALNIGLAAATSQVAVILSAHSVPVGIHFLEDIAACFRDAKLAGVRCLNVQKVRELSTWPTHAELTSIATPIEIVSKALLASGCAVRVSVWRDIPFDVTAGAVEDKVWARDVLQAGYTVSNCSATYAHLRQPTIFEWLRIRNRERTEMYRQFGCQPAYHFPTMIRSLLVAAPRAFINVVVRSLGLWLIALAVPLQSSRKPRAGSIR